MKSSMGLRLRPMLSRPDPADQIAKWKSRDDFHAGESGFLRQLQGFPPGERALDRSPPIKPADVAQAQHVRAEPGKPIAHGAAHEILDDDAIRRFAAASRRKEITASSSR